MISCMMSGSPEATASVPELPSRTQLSTTPPLTQLRARASVHFVNHVSLKAYFPCCSVMWRWNQYQTGYREHPRACCILSPRPAALTVRRQLGCKDWVSFSCKTNCTWYQIGCDFQGNSVQFYGKQSNLVSDMAVWIECLDALKIKKKKKKKL